MKWLVCAAIVLSANSMPAASAETPEIEVTGLVDLGSVRLACVRLGSDSQGLVLHPGETADGLTLKAIDAQGGWALFERGSKQFKVHLTSRVASVEAAVPVASAGPRPPRALAESGFANFERAPGLGGNLPAPGAVADSDSVAARNQASPSYAWQGMVPPNPQFVSGASGDSQFPAAASPLPAQVTAADSAPGANSNLSPEVTPLSEPGSRHLRAPDVRDLAGEQILVQYGRQAFLDWDVAQGPR